MNDIELTYQEMLFQNQIARLKAYDLYDDYYSGNHRSLFPEGFIQKIESKYNLKANYCAGIVNALVAKLKINSIKCDNKDAEKFLKDVYKYNRMDGKSIKIHRQTVIKGDCFAQVAPVMIDGKARIKITFINPEQVFAFYSSNDEDSLEYVVRQWVGYLGDVPTAFKYVYYKDKIERFYCNSSNVYSTMPQSLIYNLNNDWIPYENDPDGLGSIISNPYGMIQIVHFKNKPNDCPYGDSELIDAIPLQDSLNKLLVDLMRTSESQAFKQRYIKGLDLESIDNINPETGKKGLSTSPNSVWYLPADAEPGEFKSEDLSGIINAIKTMTGQTCYITHTPNLAEDLSGTASSGFALAQINAPLISKAREAQINFGNSYEDINTLILTIAKHHKLLSFDEVPYTEIEWEKLVELSPIDELQQAQTYAFLKQNGAISSAEIMRLRGYSDDKIKEIQEEIDKENEAAMESTIGHSFSAITPNTTNVNNE